MMRVSPTPCVVDTGALGELFDRADAKPQLRDRVLLIVKKLEAEIQMRDRYITHLEALLHEKDNG